MLAVALFFLLIGDQIVNKQPARPFQEMGIMQAHHIETMAVKDKQQAMQD